MSIEQRTQPATHRHTCTTCHLSFPVENRYCPDDKTTRHTVDRFSCIGLRCRASYKF